MRRVGGVVVGLFASTCAFSSTALASEPTPLPFRPWTLEVGARYWVSTGQSQKDLNGLTVGPNADKQVSKLVYDDLTAQSREAFFRADHRSGLFFKGYVGAGSIGGGSLDDEDYCQGGSPAANCAGQPDGTKFSDTFSKQKQGDLRFFNIDLGFTFYDSTSRHVGLKNNDGVRPGTRLGAFVGYHRWQENVHAFGVQCNPDDVPPANSNCFPPGAVVLPFSTRVISQDNTWRSLRLGLVGDFQLTERLKITGEAAYVRTSLEGADTHFFTFGVPLREDGKGNGVQLEAVLSYQVTDSFNIGVGGRYWHLGKTDGITHFEDIGFPSGSGVKWQTERYGGFVQGSLKY